MLWVYINETGTIECKVNVGNKVRQGDAFQMFICLWGQNGEAEGISDAGLYTLSNVRYLAYPNTEFVIADATPTATTKTFYLGKPSEANAHFINAVTYTGYLVDVPAEATSAYVNGGNIALEINMASSDDLESAHAETLTIYVEPTYGQKATTITTTDFQWLLSMVKQANYMLVFPLTLAQGAEAIEGLDAPAFVVGGKQFGFVRGEVTVTKEDLSDTINDYDSADDGYATIAYISSSIELKEPSSFRGKDGSGNDIRYRINGYEIYGEEYICVDVKIDDLQEGESTLYFFGTCSMDAEYLDFTNFAKSEEVGKLISAVTADVEEVLDAGEDPSVTVSLESTDTDTAILSFHFKLPRPNGIASIEDGESTPSGKTYTINFDDESMESKDIVIKDGVGFHSYSGTLASAESKALAGDYLIGDTIYFTANHPDVNIGDLYQVQSNLSLTRMGNIRGATGATGATGPAGADGANGVITESAGIIGFQVIDGQLYAYTSGDEAPNLAIDSNGQLIYTYGE